VPAPPALFPLLLLEEGQELTDALGVELPPAPTPPPALPLGERVVEGVIVGVSVEDTEGVAVAVGLPEPPKPSAPPPGRATPQLPLGVDVSE
jgi:hypothetical protein